MKIDVKSWHTGSILFSIETDSLRLALEAAVKGDADLRDANLGDADLRDANLRGANLGGANLGDADLRDANLGGADLGDANLRGADLRGANLRGADLRGANLRGADLRGADLGDANLRGANLRGADLRGADLGDAKNLPEEYLTICRDDLWAVLSAAPKEVEGLRKALLEGKVDGSHYQGECACLVGTIANLRGCFYEKMENLRPDSNRQSERFFLNISKGDTPDTNKFSKLAVDWIDQWLENMKGAFSK